ncbi:MAG: hybrid sensor histidine kinase/response regulator [Herminiimonas sp.]|nr:hybrid sensor histidine kinase/response regulator [Herminiimonas sp.]
MERNASAPFDFPASGGEMGALMRTHDWIDTPLGPPSEWPQSLHSAVGLILGSNFPMFILWGEQLVYIYNDAYIPILGARHPDTLGRPFSEVWPELRMDILPIIERALKGESNFFENLPVTLLRNGYPEQSWFTFSYSPLYDENRAVGGAFCACNETTRQVRSEQRQAFQLELSDRLRGLSTPTDITASASKLLGRYLGVTRVGYGEVDQEEKIITVSQDWTCDNRPKITGQAIPLAKFGPAIVDALRSGSPLKVDDIEADPRSAPFVRTYASIGTRSMLVIPLVKAHRLISVLSIGNESPRCWTEQDVALAQDIAERTWAAVERARAETALTRQIAVERDRLRTLFAQAPGFMAVLRGPEHVFELANSAYMRLVGVRDLIGKPVRAALPDAEGQGFFELLDRVYATGEPYSAIEAPLAIQHTPGGPVLQRYLDFIYQPVIDANGAVSGIFVEGYDVTERRHANEALREADRRKDEFLAMLAHELRNPLAPIGMAAQLLQLPGIDQARVRQTGEIISRQVGHMTDLVDDLLDVSRVTRGLVTLDRQVLGIDNIVAGAVEQVRALVEARRHRLTVQMMAGDARIEGDRTRLVQVITNLLNNAAKYTPEGGDILLRVEQHADQVRLSVRDNGIGIPAELLPHVFDLFTQGETSSDRSQGGLGMGLALVKSLVGLHQGKVTARSRGPGMGSEFTVDLPRIQNPDEQTAPQTGKAGEPSPFPALRIMIVDDNPDAAHILAMFLESQGHQVSVAYEAASALTQARTESPQVFLLDIGLPDMDGNELAEKLRALPETADSVLIALTGYGQAKDLERSKAAGFDHHIVKPADPVKLATLLADLDSRGDLGKV